MKASRSTNQSRRFMPTAMAAGFAGGLAEVVWVGLYCALTPLAGQDVLREVALASGFSGLPDAWLPAAGMGIHFALSLLVAVVLLAVGTRLLAPGLSRAAILPASALALLGIWAMNFLLVLPWLAPRFVELMPAGVTSASKLLFGLAMGTVVILAQANAEPGRLGGTGTIAAA